MIIRYATKSDIDDLVLLNQLQYPETAWDEVDDLEAFEIGMWWIDHDLLQWYYSSLQKAEGNIIVLEHDDHIIGQLDFAYGWDSVEGFEGFRYHIIWLVIHPQYRRKGFATDLVTFFRREVTSPIWVEPEDERSAALYTKLGEVIHYHSNWEIHINMIPEAIAAHRIKYEHIDYATLHSEIKDYQLLIGRYYIPNYDLTQLEYSDQVADLMWADTPAHLIHKYNIGTTKVMAYMTQFPRIFVSKGYNSSELQDILASVCLTIFELGFDSIHLQIVDEPDIVRIVQNLGFSCVTENDPVFQLHPLTQ